MTARHTPPGPGAHGVSSLPVLLEVDIDMACDEDGFDPPLTAAERAAADQLIAEWRAGEDVADDAHPITSASSGLPHGAGWSPRASLKFDLRTLQQLEAEENRIAADRARVLARMAATTDAIEAAEPTRGTSRDLEMARRSLIAEIACALTVSERLIQMRLDDAERFHTDSPTLLDHVTAGRLGFRQAQILLDHASFLPGEHRAAFIDAVLPVAESSTPPQLQRRARTLRERLHPDSITTRHQSAVAKRRVGLTHTHDGMSWLNAYLPAATAITIDTHLSDIAGHLAADGDETRTLTQLRTDVFIDLLTGTPQTNEPTNPTTAPRRRRGPRPTVMITVPALTLLGHTDEPAILDGYGPIPIETARELAGDATSFIRILTHPETGTTLSVGRDRYTVPPDLRAALHHRDTTCRFPGCNQPALTSDIDHTTDWQHGGPTTLDNLAHLCRKHHTLKHHTGWTATHTTSGDSTSDGTLTWTSPLGHTYTTHPTNAMPMRMRPRQTGAPPNGSPSDESPSPLSRQTPPPTPPDGTRGVLPENPPF